MDDTNNIKNNGSEKRWHFDVSGVETGAAGSKKTEEKTEEKTKEQKQQDSHEHQDEAAGYENAGSETGSSGRRFGKRLRKRILTGKMLRRYVPWIIMVVGLFLVLIYNRYAIEDLVKEKNATTERIKYLREHKIQMQKKYQESTKISKLAEELDTLKIGIMSGPPYEL